MKDVYFALAATEVIEDSKDSSKEDEFPSVE